MRDHTKLRAFQLADQLALLVYKSTANFPKYELFGLVTQMRRAAVSVPSNIVEGCARRSQAEYLRFLDVAFASSKELGYQLSLAYRLKYLDEPTYESVHSVCEETTRVLTGLIHSHRPRTPSDGRRNPDL